MDPGKESLLTGYFEKVNGKDSFLGSASTNSSAKLQALCPTGLAEPRNHSVFSEHKQFMVSLEFLTAVVKEVMNRCPCPGSHTSQCFKHSPDDIGP